MNKAILRLGLAAISLAASSQAATITLQLINSYARTAPFGLAFDGTNIYWSDSGAVIHQMTTAGTDTGVQWVGPYWSELAWDGSRNQLAVARGSEVRYFDVGGGNVTTKTLTDPMTGITSLIDGFDIDNGQLWLSPDIGNVYRYSNAGTFAGSNPFLGGAGGYSGVERVDVGGTTYIIVVNDASDPRRLCVHDLSAAELGCQNFVNQRYEGLAFDGRYLWAADFRGNKIDKFDVLSDGGSIFIPSDGGGAGGEIPEPSGILLLSGGGLIALGVRRRARR